MPPIDTSALEVTRYDVSERVATITLHRPERLNAWTARMNAEYRACLQRAGGSPLPERGDVRRPSSGQPQ